MKRFINERICIKCETKKELNDFLKRCEKKGLKWADGQKATEYKPSRLPCYLFCVFNNSIGDKFLSWGEDRFGYTSVTYKEYFKDSNKHKFKVGDIVETKFGKGKIININNDTCHYLVYHLDWSGGHDDGSIIDDEYGHGNHCWWFSEGNIKLPSKEETITITRHDNKVVAKYSDKVGVAKCNPEDEFNFETGAKLAFERLFDGDKKEDSQSKSKEPFKPYLECSCENVGYIGEKTPITDIFDRPLVVGDTVRLIHEDGKTFEVPIVKKNGKFFVMGIERRCNEDGTIDGPYVIIKNRDHSEIKNGEELYFTKYVLSED